MFHDMARIGTHEVTLRMPRTAPELCLVHLASTFRLAKLQYCAKASRVIAPKARGITALSVTIRCVSAPTRSEQSIMELSADFL
jgi:hypothetical protein